MSSAPQFAVGSRLWHSQRRGGQGADRAIQKPQRHPVILKTAVGANFSHAEARFARDEVVGLPERSEPEGTQGAARGRERRESSYHSR